jgi:hypothetical protein
VTLVMEPEWHSIAAIAARYGVTAQRALGFATLPLAQLRGYGPGRAGTSISRSRSKRPSRRRAVGPDVQAVIQNAIDTRGFLLMAELYAAAPDLALERPEYLVAIVDGTRRMLRLGFVVCQQFGASVDMYVQVLDDGTRAVPSQAAIVAALASEVLRGLENRVKS